MLALDEKADVAETTFCRSEGHSEPWGLRVIITILVLLMLMPFLMYNVFLFSKKIQLFPLKARGPRLVLLQMIYFVLLNLIPLAIEGLVSSEIINWGKSDRSSLRNFLKGIYFLTRISVNLIFIHRTLLIYANWKVPLDSLYNRFWAIFGNEIRSIIVDFRDKAFLLMQGVLLIFFIAVADYLATGFSSLDIYRANNQNWYFIFNLTLIEIVENCVLLLCFYVLRYFPLIRNYPREFLIKQEILFSLVCSVLINIVSENTFNNVGFFKSKKGCFLDLVTWPYALNLLRAILFIGYLSLITRQATFYFPYPFMWIFRDFSKFIFEPYCIRVFEGYLANREPQSRLCLSELENFERIILSYLGKPSRGSRLYAEGENEADFSINNEDVSDSIDQLGRSFDNFKRTVSCGAVISQIKQFEEINKRLDR